MKKYTRALKFIAFYLLFLGILYLNSGAVFLIGNFISLLLSITLKFMPFLVMASILIKDYNSLELLSALQVLALPRVLITTFIITLRYIPTFAREN